MCTSHANSLIGYAALSAIIEACEQDTLENIVNHVNVINV